MAGTCYLLEAADAFWLAGVRRGGPHGQDKSSWNLNPEGRSPLSPLDSSTIGAGGSAEELILPPPNGTSIIGSKAGGKFFFAAGKIGIFNSSARDPLIIPPPLS